MKNYNSTSFIPEEVEAGLHLDLVKYLLDYNSKSGKHFNDIHITIDGYCTIVEWCEQSLEEVGGGRFEFVDSDEVIMLEKLFPDNHYELCYDEEDYNSRLEEWLYDNPGWVKNEYDMWTNEIENERFRKEMERQMKETSDLIGHDWVVNEPEDDTDTYHENGVPQQ